MCCLLVVNWPVCMPRGPPYCLFHLFLGCMSVHPILVYATSQEHLEGMSLAQISTLTLIKFCGQKLLWPHVHPSLMNSIPQNAFQAIIQWLRNKRGDCNHVSHLIGYWTGDTNIGFPPSNCGDCIDLLCAAGLKMCIYLFEFIYSLQQHPYLMHCQLSIGQACAYTSYLFVKFPQSLHYNYCESEQI